MKNWQTYKETYRTESDLFDFARTGDLRGLANLLSQNNQLDLDATNQKGYSALMLAVYNGQQDFCEALLRSGADVNSKDSIGNSVLMGCAFKGNLETLKLLLQFGARTTDTNKAKMNARDWALMFKRTEIVQHLDNTFPNTVNASKIKNILRFIKLSFLMLRTKMKNTQNQY